MALRFRIPRQEDAELTLKWRSDPEVTRFMFSDLDHDVTAQRDWLAQCLTRDDYRHFLICWDDEPVGFLNYSGIDWQHRHCSSGHYIYGADNQRRYAGLLHSYLMHYCFYALGMHKTIGYFMAGNERMVKIQHLLKLRQVGILRDQVYKQGRFHDVHCFELLRSEWEGHTHLYPRDVALAAFESWPVPAPIDLAAEVRR